MPPAGATEVPFALAFGAGLVASVNPCGFALLPSVLVYYLGASGDGEGRWRVADGLVAGLVLAAGFMVVFGVVGGAFALGARAIVRAVPWLTVAIGAALVLMGGWLLAGRHLAVPLPGIRAGRGRGYRSLFMFGTAYAVGSLSCTLPVFLVVVGAGFAAGSVMGTLAVFLAYGLGMATVLMLLCLGTAGFRELFLRKVRRLLPHLNRISGGLLVLGGAYVVYYWLSLLAGQGESAPVRVAQDLQRWVQRIVLGVSSRVWFLVGIGLAAAALLLVAVRVLRQTGGSDEDSPESRRDPGEERREDLEETRT